MLSDKLQSLAEMLDAWAAPGGLVALEARALESLAFGVRNLVELAAGMEGQPVPPVARAHDPKAPLFQVYKGGRVA